MREYLYDEATNTFGIKTSYDPTEVIEANKAQKAQGRVMIGSKGQQMLHAMRIDIDHVEALINKGYNLLSPDPDEVRRALLYIQQNEQDWMVTDGKVIAQTKQRWA
jgi:hypothetical protein